jgi:8-oxo-dGTP diphosphatase
MTLASAAIGIIFNEDKTRVLLVKRKDIPIWVLPGGGIDLNETAEEAVVREIEEETGVQVAIERKCAEYYPENRLGAFTNVFICKVISGTPIVSDETSEVGFYPLNNFPSFFFTVHRIWIEDAINHTSLIRAPLKGVNYVEFIKCLLKHPLYTLRYITTRLTKNS